MISSANAKVATPETSAKSRAFEKSIETQSGSFATQYRWACDRPRLTNSAQTGGQSTITKRSPRPAGPSAHALNRLVSTPQSRISALALKTSRILRASKLIHRLNQEGSARGTKKRQAAPSAVRIAGIVRNRILQS